jgi:hypothetical protein
LATALGFALNPVVSAFIEQFAQVSTPDVFSMPLHD